MTCDNCGQTVFRPDEVTKTFTVDERLIVVEDIPAAVCDGCGATHFSADVAERLRRLVHEPHQAVRVIQAEVLRFHAA